MFAVTHLNGSLNSVFESRHGYWGDTITPFCEEGYAVSSFLAEFFNTVSNVWFLVAAIPALLAWKRFRLELRFFILALLVVAVGAGSAIYHLTMLNSTRSFDGIPMMLLQGELSFIFLAMGLLPNRDPLLSKALPVVFAYASVILALLGFRFPIAFNDLFLLSSVVYLPLAAVWATGPSVPRSDRLVRTRVCVAAYAFFAVGCACWVADKVFCEHLRAIRHEMIARWGPVRGTALSSLLQMHGWWHICSAAAVCLISALAQHARLGVLAPKGVSPVPMRRLLMPWLPAARAHGGGAAAPRERRGSTPALYLQQTAPAGAGIGRVELRHTTRRGVARGLAPEAAARA